MRKTSLARISDSSFIARFNARVDRDGPRVGRMSRCWTWTGTMDGKGYGRMYTAKAAWVMAHRVAWEIANGAIPDDGSYHGVCVLHRCDNPSCVNVAHLFLGTTAENTRDRIAKGRPTGGNTSATAARGAANGATKLEPKQVLVIRAERVKGVQLKVLAARYGISVQLVSAIANRECWRHI